MSLAMAYFTLEGNDMKMIEKWSWSFNLANEGAERR